MSCFVKEVENTQQQLWYVSRSPALNLFLTFSIVFGKWENWPFFNLLASFLAEMHAIWIFTTYIAQCVYRESQAFMMKIPMAYHKAPTTKFRLFWDVDNWNFSNIKTYDAFRILLLLLGLLPFSQVSSS